LILQFSPFFSDLITIHFTRGNAEHDMQGTHQGFNLVCIAVISFSQTPPSAL